MKSQFCWICDHFHPHIVSSLFWEIISWLRFHLAYLNKIIKIGLFVGCWCQFFVFFCRILHSTIVQHSSETKGYAPHSTLELWIIGLESETLLSKRHTYKTFSRRVNPRFCCEVQKWKRKYYLKFVWTSTNGTMDMYK